MWGVGWSRGVLVAESEGSPGLLVGQKSGVVWVGRMREWGSEEGQSEACVENCNIIIIIIITRGVSVIGSYLVSLSCTSMQDRQHLRTVLATRRTPLLIAALQGNIAG